MVATSQPLATRAGLRMLERGGNAVDAAIAAAAALCVAEPMSTGIGGDCFAIIWKDGLPVGLQSSGPAPRTADPNDPVADIGPCSVTVPGAVAGWGVLAECYGTFGLDACLADAIGAAEQGVAVSPMCAKYWRQSDRAPAEFGPAPSVGEIYRLPELGATLRRIAEDGPRVMYAGSVADAICEVSWLKNDDLATFAPTWVDPIEITYRGVRVLELPPPNQGVIALEALGLLEPMSPTLTAQVACVRLALEDGFARVHDGADVSELTDPAFLDQRRRDLPIPVVEAPGGTVYLCVVDGNGMAVSFIQSLFHGFGSGVVAPGTGVVLQNRAACFAVGGGRVEPGRRPFHTIIPGLLVRDGDLWGPFGVMGGFIQAQAHVQLVHALVDRELDPQAALDEPRFRVEGTEVAIEEGLVARRAELAPTGLRVRVDPDVTGFGGGQAILREGDALVGGSDRRKDGYAAGF